MTSLSSHRDARYGATPLSEQSAHPRGVRPGPEAPAPGGFFCSPDLLQGRPVVGRPLRPQEPGCVRVLEAEVHLQPAVVGATGVGPAPLVMVDAEELPQMRRVLGPDVGRMRAVLP